MLEIPPVLAGSLLPWPPARLGGHSAALLLLLLACPGGSGAEPNLPITSAQGVRDLSPEEADRGHEVQLQGVVLYFNPKTGADLMICDETAAVYVAGTSRPGLACRAGELVAVDGQTSGGDFAPMVVASSIRRLGQGRLPPPRERNFSELITGAEDGQWVKVSGIVRAATVEPVSSESRLSLTLAVGEGRLIVRVPDVGALDGALLVDTEATVTGICFPVFNRRRQLLGIRLRAPALSFVHFSAPAGLATFATALQPISSLLQFRPGGLHRHRVRVQGTVALPPAGENLVIRDDTQALWIKAAAGGSLQPGDVVDVLGFPAFGEYNPTLEDAVFRPTGRRHSLPPRALDASTAVSGEQDAELVRLEGTVVASSVSGRDGILDLRRGQQLFRAHLPLGAPFFSTYQPGSRLRLDGVCQVEPAAASGLFSFQLLLRSAADVRVLGTPSWWTLRRVAFTLALTTGVSLGAMAWVFTLGRRVRRQTSEIQRKVEREAVLEERSRIAREFHDTLEQELAGVLLQLQAARQRVLPGPAAASEVLGIAESMLRHTQSEARNSIWDLRALALENGSLESALRTVADAAVHGHAIAITVTIEGTPCLLSSRVENHLLRIAQEATANALRHAAPQRIRLFLGYGSDAVRLRIEDDGLGFEVSDHPARPGHFGFLGMRERAEKIGGVFSFQSSLGIGTCIEITWPKEPAILSA